MLPLDVKCSETRYRSLLGLDEDHARPMLQYVLHMCTCVHLDSPRHCQLHCL